MAASCAAADDRRGEHRDGRLALRRLRSPTAAASRAPRLRCPAGRSAPRPSRSDRRRAVRATPRSPSRAVQAAARRAMPPAARAPPSPRRRAASAPPPESDDSASPATAPRCRIADGAHVARRILSAFVTRSRFDAVEAVERPQRVQARPRSPARCSASFTSAGATDLSPRSTSSRCAVSRRQPFGCDSASTSCAGDAAANGFACRAGSSRARRDRCGRDPTGASSLREMMWSRRYTVVDARCWMIAAIHVDDVQRAVGRVGQIDRPEALVGRREELGVVVRLARPQRRAVVADDDAARPDSPRARRRTTLP